MNSDGIPFARATLYEGVMMRSRLEAAWAEQFDALGWSWKYEPVCIGTTEGQYLPDFKVTVPHFKRTIWFEVKGGWWEDIAARGLTDDAAGWDALYTATFADRRKMSAAIAEMDPNGVLVLAHQSSPGLHHVSFWSPGRVGSTSDWPANIVRCPEGCTSLVRSLPAHCHVHTREWQRAELVASLYGQQRPVRESGTYDELDIVLHNSNYLPEMWRW